MPEEFDESRSSRRDWYKFTVDALADRDIARKRSTSSLADIAAKKAEQENEQRDKLMTFVLRLVTVAMISVVAFVALLLFPQVNIDPIIAVAFISAVAVQSFAIIGFIARGLYSTPSSQKSSSHEQVE